MKRTLTLIAAVLITTASPLLAVAQHQIIDMRLDPVGDADISITMKFDAGAWQMWKQTIGENPSVMKREIERMFSTITLDGFTMDRNDLEREVTVQLHAIGLARYLGNGRWEADVETDDSPGASVSRRKISDTTYLTTATMSDPGSGAVMRQEITLNIPEGAGSLTEAHSETGTDLLRYELTPATASGGNRVPLFAAGGGCAALGLVLILLGGRVKTDA